MAGTTENLGFYFKEPLKDGADTFNIQTMLNNNWAILDAVLSGLSREKALPDYIVEKLKSYIPADEKGAANGVAKLGEDGKVPADELPSMDYIPTDEKGASNGVATLGEDSKVPESQLPDMDYVKSSEKGAANGVATLDSDGNVSEDQLAIKIKKFTYTGTGTYGSNGSNRTIIGIDGFIPKLVVISDGYDVALIPIINVSGGATKGIYFSILSESVTFADNSYAMIPIYARLVTAFYPSVTLYLYTNVTDKNQAACQMNASGTEYTVIAIGSEYTQES